MLLRDLVIPDGATELELRAAITALQQAQSGPTGYGKWITPPLTADSLKPDNANNSWSFGGTSGSRISYTLIGDTMILDFVIGRGPVSVLLAPCTYLYIKIPDGYERNVRASGQPPNSEFPVFIVDAGSGFAGFGLGFTAGLNKKYIQLSTIVGGFTGPGITVSGHVAFECIQGQR